VTSTKPSVFVSGRLVTLREKQLDDARRDYEWRRDPELAAYDAARPISMSFRSFAAALSDELQSPSMYRRSFAIEVTESGLHIGNVMFYSYDPTRQEAELGITIGDRDYWSRGFGTDAVATMLLYLFRERGLERVYLHTLSWNHRAQAAFNRTGFRFVRPVHRDGYDFHLMEVHRADVLGAEA